MTGQNTSSAVMQQRAAAPDALDYFPTPPWAARALCEWLELKFGALESVTCWEPACGEGHMVRGLRDHFGSVIASDVFPYSEDHYQIDFLAPGDSYALQADWIITNPPFLLGDQFVRRALDLASSGVAMLVRSAFTESEGRYDSLFRDRPPSYELQFVERVPMLRGRLIRSGAPDPFNLDPQGEPRKASTATAYSWLVWHRDGKGWNHDTRKRWIAPCRHRLEREGDYPAYADQWAKIAPPQPEGMML